MAENEEEFDLDSARRKLKYLKCAKVFVENDPMLKPILEYKDSIAPDYYYSKSDGQTVRENVTKIINKMRESDIPIEELKTFTNTLMTEYDASYSLIELEDIIKAIDQVYKTSFKVPDETLQL